MERTADTRPAATFELAALRLHLAVGMAAADGELHEAEVAELHSFVAGSGIGDAERAFLDAMLARLLRTPPALDVLLRSLVDRIDRPELGRMLIDDLVAIANVDGHIDPREEGLLRLVCGALEVDPVTLYDPPLKAGAEVTASELSALVRRLLDLDAA